MPDNKKLQELSPEEKLSLFYTTSATQLKQISDNGRAVLLLVDELALPYHVFNWCRCLVEETSKLLSLLDELIKGNGRSNFEAFEKLSVKRKLSNFRSEYTTQFQSWKFQGQLMYHWLEEREAFNFPNELKDWSKQVIDSVVQIQELLKTLLNIPPPPQEQGSNLFPHAEAALQQRRTYLAMLKEASHRLGVPLIETLSDYSIFDTEKRRATSRIQNNSSLPSFEEYMVTFQWRTNDQFQTWQEYAAIAKSIDEVVYALDNWLANCWDLKRMVQEHAWMSQAVIGSSLRCTWLPKYLKVKGGHLQPLVSAQNVYEVDINSEGRLVVEALQESKKEKQIFAIVETQKVSVNSQEAIYRTWIDEQKDIDDQIKNGFLEWVENGITYSIHHVGLKIEESEIIKIAESIRWGVLTIPLMD